MNLGGSPTRFLFGQTSDQAPDFLRDCRPPAIRSTLPTPVQTTRRQAMSVSGFTMTRRSAHRGQRRRSVVQKSRSKQFNGGRGRLRFSTASCWRQASTSSAVSLRVLKKTLTAARRTRRIRPRFTFVAWGSFMLAAPAGRRRKLLICTVIGFCLPTGRSTPQSARITGSVNMTSSTLSNAPLGIISDAPSGPAHHYAHALPAEIVRGRHLSQAARSG